MVLTDLDGTLLNNDSSISFESIETLRILRQKKIVTVAATGRTVYSANKVLPEELPLDYLVFSSGAGILDFQTKKIIKSSNLSQSEICKVSELLLCIGLDFSIHQPVPDNHKFYWYASDNPCEDFLRRVQLYKEHAIKGTSIKTIFMASQFLAICLNGYKLIDQIKAQLPDLSIIRATSPLDKTHTWIEIFPEKISKGSGAEWLSNRLGINQKYTFSIGNDYNDIHMLDWTKSSYIVSNAPEELRLKYRPALSNENNGFYHAINDWITEYNF